MKNAFVVDILGLVIMLISLGLVFSERLMGWEPEKISVDEAMEIKPCKIRENSNLALELDPMEKDVVRQQWCLGL